MNRLPALLTALLLSLLAACAPTAQLYPPEAPLVYSVPYRTLFDRTLQELTAAYLPDALERRPFSVTQADPETGLITAVRNERGPTATLRYRYPYDANYDVDEEDVYEGSGFPFGFGLAFAVPVPASRPEQTLLTVVVRPEGEGASLIYSAQDPDGSSSEDGVRLMRGVIAQLEARFRTPTAQTEGGQ